MPQHCLTSSITQLTDLEDLYQLLGLSEEALVSQSLWEVMWCRAGDTRTPSPIKYATLEYTEYTVL